MVKNSLFRFKNLIKLYPFIPLIFSIIFIVFNATRLFLGYTNLSLIYIQITSFIIIISYLMICLLTILYLSVFHGYKFKFKKFCLILLLLIIYLYLFIAIKSIISQFILVFLFNLITPYIVKTEISVFIKKKNLNYLKVGSISAFIIIVSFSYLMFELSIRNLNSVEAISEYVFTRNYYYREGEGCLEYFRSGSDIYQWIFLGIGHCGEVAYVSQYILEKKGYEAYVASFPGEDHMFTLVKLNNSWYVVDPGYYGRKVLSLEDRVHDRIREYGNISSIVAYIIKRDVTGLIIWFEGFIDLTRDYVPHDMFVICVTCNKQPITSAKIVLKHKFHGGEFEIPSNGLSYYTNATGCVVIYLGGSEYTNPGAKPYDPFFQIYVNNKSTNVTVTSTLQGKVFVIKIDTCGYK